jgi:uncharacterized Ntn-hydrolase superfamily protein
LLAADANAQVRQVAMIDAEGRVAAHTGTKDIQFAGHEVGENFSVQANLMASNQVWPSMAKAFRAANGDLADRMLAALDAAEEAGGDFRGRESAALVVVSGDREQEPWQRVFDVRVDNHPEPLRELRRLHSIAAAYRRRDGFDEHTNLEEEVEFARAAGLPEEQVAFSAALVAVTRGDLDAAAEHLGAAARADARWREAFERYVRLDVIPAAVLDRLA